MNRKLNMHEIFQRFAKIFNLKVYIVGMTSLNLISFVTI